MDVVSIQFSRFSAFYSPLISTMSGDFLKNEGLSFEWSTAGAGVPAVNALIDGSAHVIQSAPSQSFLKLANGDTPAEMHFAQVNEMDGFFLAGQKPDPNFAWEQLNGAKIIVDQSSVQPLSMLKYACYKQGLDFNELQIIDAGSGASKIEAFRSQKGDYIHLQGPAPQQLEYERFGYIVTAVGPAIGPCAFSSLAATRDWLKTDTAIAFTRAYKRARRWLLSTPSDVVAKTLKIFFPDTHIEVLASTIDYYQKLGNWTPELEISKISYEAALDVFEYSGQISKRPAYEAVVALPPV